MGNALNWNETPWPRHEEDGVAYYTAPGITARHVFTTRLGGVSTGALESLNLSVRRGDEEPRVRENWARLGRAARLDLRGVACARQVHGSDVRIARAADLQPPEREPRVSCDGFVTNEPGVPLAVFLADCLPVLLHDAAAGVIGAVHCGWRSSVADILGVAVEKMVSLGARPARIHAAVGPGIGACCFEVGPEVADGINRLLRGETEGLLREKPDGRYMADLKRANARRLAQLGVPAAQIDLSGLCTMCRPEEFWSHRKTNGHRGVQAAIITL